MKIQKALIIRRSQLPLSKEYAENCIESCEKFKIPYEVINAVEFLSCEEAFESVGTFKQKSYIPKKDGHCNCHASHIKCWKRIIELNKACIILEHDAVIKGDVLNIDIVDDTVTTFGLRVVNLDDYKPPASARELVKIESSMGTHAYGITPKTAQWLWEDVRDNGVADCVDNWLMKYTRSGLPLFMCEPPQAVSWARISTMDLNIDTSEEELKSGKHYSEVHNNPSGFTQGWLDGFNDIKNKTVI